MDTKYSKRAISASLKRKRGTAANEATPALKHGDSRKKIDNTKNTNLNSANKAARDTTGETVQAIVTHSYLIITTPGDTNIESISSETNTTCDDTNSILDKTASKPTLQTLPRELRNLIYDFVAATEERIVLGRCMVEAEKSDSTKDLDDCFGEAVALHPLSMTCRQFRDEFQAVHTAATGPPWILLVNNFDLEQLHMFGRYIMAKHAVVSKDDVNDGKEDFDPCGFPTYDSALSLRFQMDDGALKSASDLCDNVYFFDQGAAPSCLADPEAKTKVLSIAEIATRYVPRTTAGTGKTHRRSVTFNEMQKIETKFKALRGNVVDMPSYEWQGFHGPFGPKLGRVPNSFAYMEQCWFEPLYQVAEDLRERKAERDREDIRRTMHRLMYGEDISYGGFDYAD